MKYVCMCVGSESGYEFKNMDSDCAKRFGSFQIGKYTPLVESPGGEYAEGADRQYDSHHCRYRDRQKIII